MKDQILQDASLNRLLSSKNSRTKQEHSDCCKNTTHLFQKIAENKGKKMADMLDFYANIY